MLGWKKKIKKHENSNYLKEGTILDNRYEIVRFIKQGGFGIVYLVKDLDTNIELIVKELFFINHSIRNRNGGISNRKIRSNDVSFDKLKEDIKNEINKLKSIENQNIVKAYDFFEENNTIYSVMEYIKGIDLEDYLKDNSFNESEAKDLLRQIINGLKEIHNESMVHRDMKPSNIMRGKNGIYKIIDFTTSKVYSNRTSTVTGIRAPLYCPPELESNKKKVKIGNFSDIYSIGIILIRLFCKQRNIPNLVDRLIDDTEFHKLVSNLNISRVFRGVIIKMTELDPPKRFQNLEEIEDVLFGRIEKDRVFYKEKMSSSNPGCIILMIDQSWSMNEVYGENKELKKDLAARVVNSTIYEIIRASASGRGYKNRCYISVIGYGEEVKMLLEDYLVGVAENPLRLDRDKKRDHRSTPIWIEPRAYYDTPMDSAFRRASEIAQNWVNKHPNSFPPLVINISDGEPTYVEDTRAEAKKLREISSNDGNVLLLNTHIGDGKKKAIKLPHDSSIFSDELAKFLFDISSELPDRLMAEAKKEGFDVDKGARGMIYNSDSKDLIRLLNFGSSVAR